TVGGTNPSLIEAMACGCQIAAHSNRFNRAVLHENAGYFSTVGDVKTIITNPEPASVADQWKNLNLKKVSTMYNQQRIVDSYEKVMLNACRVKDVSLQPSIAEAV